MGGERDKEKKRKKEGLERGRKERLNTKCFRQSLKKINVLHNFQMFAKIQSLGLSISLNEGL